MSYRATGEPSLAGSHLSATWNASAAARRFVGAPGGATVGVGAAADGPAEAEEPPVEATTAPMPPRTRINAPTTIRTIGHRRRGGGAAGAATPLAGDGPASGDPGRRCGATGGGGNSSIGPLPLDRRRGSITREPGARRGDVASAVCPSTASRSGRIFPKARGSCAPPLRPRRGGAPTVTPRQRKTSRRGGGAGLASRLSRRTGSTGGGPAP